MVRKKKFKISPYVKFILVCVLIVGIGFVVVNRSRYVLRHSGYFRIQSVVVDSSLEFIGKDDLKNLIGKSIFAIDLKAVEVKLKHKYPQASELKVIKRYPSQISVIAQKRVPAAQLQVDNKNIVIDQKGVVLSIEDAKNNDLVTIIDGNVKNAKQPLGLPIRESSSLWTALKIIKHFKDNDRLANYPIEVIDVVNTSKILLTLSNHLEIIMDRDGISQKTEVLSTVLSQGQLNLSDIKYIDLRFKEPVLGKK